MTTRPGARCLFCSSTTRLDYFIKGTKLPVCLRCAPSRRQHLVRIEDKQPVEAPR